MIDKATEAKILRHHFVEQWGVNTIARQLGIHHSTVDRVLAQAGLPKAERARRPSIVDPYHPLIIETLAQYPTFSAARLLGMAQARGYTGGASQLRAHVAQLRPRRPREAYLRLKTLPGEQGQVDWGHFGAPADRPRQAPADGLCHGAELQSADLPALLSQSAHGQLSARPCRRLRRVFGRPAGPAVRQPALGRA